MPVRLDRWLVFPDEPSSSTITLEGSRKLALAYSGAGDPASTARQGPGRRGVQTKRLSGETVKKALRGTPHSTFHAAQEAAMFVARLRAGLAGAWREGRLGSVLGVYWTLIAVVGFPVAETIVSHPTPPRLLQMLAGVGLFLALACWMFLRHLAPVEPVPRVRWIGLGALGTIALALNLLDAPRWHWFGLFFTVATAAAWALPPRLAVRVLGAVFACVALLLRLSGASLLLTVALLTVLALISVQMMNRRRLEVTNSALRSAREELTRLAVAEERLRFARDLHDLLGHSLSTITLK